MERTFFAILCQGQTEPSGLFTAQNVVFAMVWMLAILYVISLLQTRKQKKQLAAQNKEISDQKDALEKQHSEITKQKSTLSKSYDDIQLLTEFGQAVSASLNSEMIMMAAYGIADSMMEVSGFGIGLLEKDHNRLFFEHAMEGGSLLPNFSYHVVKDDQVALYSFRSKTQVVINDFEKEWSHFLRDTPNMSSKNTPMSIMCIPLRNRDEVFGVIQAFSYKRNAYGSTEINIFKNIASYVAIALSNTEAFLKINYINDNLTSSINYAKTIQQAVLPDEDKLSALFDDHLLIYRPKDIVSGDFYWVAEPRPGLKLIAVADCTGHGVPGAFMSLIGIRLLDNIALMKHVYEPAKILEELHESIIRVLKQDSTDNSDGIHLGILAILEDREKHVVSFAGAKTNLFRNNGETLEIFKGTRKSAGGILDNYRQFEQHQMTIAKGEMLYMASDGFTDQFNQNRKRFGTFRLRNLIAGNLDRSFREQKKILEDALDHHQGEVAQIDDITLLAIKL